jgi:hypothetical protein
MQPTAKWNEELPLNPAALIPPPPPRRYEIQIDRGRRIPLVITTVKPRPAQPLPRMVRGMYQIHGTPIREDELMEYAADTSKGALVLDARGQIHRPGETMIPGGTTMRMNVGETVTSFPSGTVISRGRLANLIRSGRLTQPPNVVNAFRSGRLRKRKTPFPPGLAWEAAALTNPGAFHALAISPNAHLKMKRRRALARAVASGHVVIGRDGTVYKRVPTAMGGFSLRRIGRVIKRTAQRAGGGVASVARRAGGGVASAASATARQAARGALATGRFAKQHAGKLAMIALGPAGFILALSKDKLLAAAKAMARVAAYPIKRAARPAVLSAARKLARGGPVTHQHNQAASRIVISRFKRSGNPLAKFAGLVLQFVGTGVSGTNMAGVAIVRRDTSIIGGYITGCAGDSVIGFTGAEIAAAASATVAAIIPLIKQMVADFAKSKAQDLAHEAGEKFKEKTGLDPNEAYRQAAESKARAEREIAAAREKTDTARRDAEEAASRATAEVAERTRAEAEQFAAEQRAAREREEAARQAAEASNPDVQTQAMSGIFLPDYSGDDYTGETYLGHCGCKD